MWGWQPQLLSTKTKTTTLAVMDPHSAGIYQYDWSKIKVVEMIITNKGVLKSMQTRLLKISRNNVNLWDVTIQTKSRTKALMTLNNLLCLEAVSNVLFFLLQPLLLRHPFKKACQISDPLPPLSPSSPIYPRNISFWFWVCVSLCFHFL